MTSFPSSTFCSPATRAKPPAQSASKPSPKAIACALADKIVSAKQKGSIRRARLKQAGVDAAALSNIDKVDAALCALAAHHLALGAFKSYGEPVSGLIAVPGSVPLQVGTALDGI